jgi:hypothetical protein
MLTVANQLKFAHAAGWTGTGGITSSTAATDHSRAIGIAEASTLLGLTADATATFLGQEADATSLLVRLTLLGDANLDGVVDFTDLTAIAQNYNTTLPAAAFAFSPDFQADWARAQSEVPEPTSVLLLSLTASTALTGRRRRFAGH